MAFKAILLMASLLLCIFTCECIDLQNKSENQVQWLVIQNESELKIFYGNNSDSPQYATLHLNDSYFRLINGPSSGWGTSVILLPAFWTNGTYNQGAPVYATWRFLDPDLVLYIEGTIISLNVSSVVRIEPPENGSIIAHVTNTINGSIPLDSRPSESFKPVMLSSMHISPTMWDAQLAVEGNADLNYSIPDQGWITTGRTCGRTSDEEGCDENAFFFTILDSSFGLIGGTSKWKINAPTITIDLNQPMQIAGWVTHSDNPNDDNVGYWAASEDILHSYEYTITATSS